MKVSIFLAMLVSISTQAFAAPACNEAPKIIQMGLALDQIFSSSKGLDPITYQQGSQTKTARVEQLIPSLGSVFSGSTYAIRGHGRAQTQVFLVLDSNLITAQDKGAMAELLKLEKSYDDKKKELIIIRNKVASEFALAVKRLRGPAENFDHMVTRYRYLTVPSDAETPADLLEIQGTLSLYLKTDQWIRENDGAKKKNVSNHPLMIDFRRQQALVASKLSRGWSLSKADCHDSGSLYRVYENFDLKGAYVVLETRP